MLFGVATRFFVLITVLTLSSCAQTELSATPTDLPTPTQVMLSTPQLIDQALSRGEITDEERLLYLAYAIFEYESLPTRFQSNVGWRGTAVLEELEKAANSRSVLCSMSLNVRSEFQRLLKPETRCD